MGITIRLGHKSGFKGWVLKLSPKVWYNGWFLVVSKDLVPRLGTMVRISGGVLRLGFKAWSQL